MTFSSDSLGGGKQTRMVLFDCHFPIFIYYHHADLNAPSSRADPTVIYQSSQQFRSSQDFVNNVKAVISEAQSNFHLVYTNIAQDWADIVFNQLDPTLESSKARLVGKIWP